MCEVGGPRCASSVRAGLDRALVRREVLAGEVEALRAGGRVPGGRLLDRVARNAAKVEDLSVLFDSTPRGQRLLVAEIEAAEDAELCRGLERRLGLARERREREVALGERRRAELLNERKGKEDVGEQKGSDGFGGGNVVGRGSGGVFAGAGRVRSGVVGGGSSGDRGSVAGRGYSDVDRQRTVLVGGREIAVKGVVPRPSRVDVLAERGRSAPDLYELKSENAGDFRRAMEDLRVGNPFHASVYVYPEDEYRDMRMFVTEDGKAGFALHGDDVVSVFSRGDSEYRGCVGTLMATAVDQGGRRLDCFDTVLPRVYASAGFEPVARLKWNDEYAPDAWDYETYSRFNEGRPDVVFMRFNEAKVDGVYEPGAGSYVDDYDQGTAAQRG